MRLINAARFPLNCTLPPACRTVPERTGGKFTTAALVNTNTILQKQPKTCHLLGLLYFLQQLHMPHWKTLTHGTSQNTHGTSQSPWMRMGIGPNGFETHPHENGKNSICTTYTCHFQRGWSLVKAWICHWSLSALPYYLWGFCFELSNDKTAVWCLFLQSSMQMITINSSRYTGRYTSHARKTWIMSR